MGISWQFQGVSLGVTHHWRGFPTRRKLGAILFDERMREQWRIQIYEAPLGGLETPRHHGAKLVKGLGTCSKGMVEQSGKNAWWVSHPIKLDHFPGIRVKKKESSFFRPKTGPCVWHVFIANDVGCLLHLVVKQPVWFELCSRKRSWNPKNAKMLLFISGWFSSFGGSRQYLTKKSDS